MKITFCGGAQSVTGANYLLDVNGFRFLVDCGLFQGSSYAEELNYQPFPYNPHKISALCVTHSHTDHIGRIPKLWKDGFRGEIYATEPAVDLIKVALPDNANIIADEAGRMGREPLFSEEDVEGAVKLLSPVKYYKKIKLNEDVSVVFHNAGHVLGSAVLEVQAEGKKIYFTGDLGNPPTPLLPYPDKITDADYVIVESAYGDRIHEDKLQRKNILEKTIEDTVSRGGVLMIPSFALERTQELLYELNELVENNRIPKVPIFIDSPLAIRITDVYKKYQSYFNSSATHVIKSGDNIFDFPGLVMTLTAEESKAINNVKPPKIIIAGSGMSNGGRIIHHEKRYLSDPKSTILFVGYQAAGTLGRRILEGESSVKMFGEDIKVRCSIRSIGGYSAHADQAQLVEWIKNSNINKKLKKVFVVQGEPEASLSLATLLKDRELIDSYAPKSGEEVII